MIRYLGCFACIAVLTIGCTSSETRENRAVLEAISNLRDSSPDDPTKRREFIAALAKVPATSPLAREARDTCADAYRFIVEGREATRKIKAELEELGTAPKNAVEDLAAAKELLDKSETSMRACQKATVELTMKRH